MFELCDISAIGNQQMQTLAMSMDVRGTPARTLIQDESTMTASYFPKYSSGGI
jgi:hypothetical protein